MTQEICVVLFFISAETLPSPCIFLSFCFVCDVCGVSVPGRQIQTLLPTDNVYWQTTWCLQTVTNQQILHSTPLSLPFFVCLPVFLTHGCHVTHWFLDYHFVQLWVIALNFASTSNHKTFRNRRLWCSSDEGQQSLTDSLWPSTKDSFRCLMTP